MFKSIKIQIRIGLELNPIKMEQGKGKNDEFLNFYLKKGGLENVGSCTII